MYQQRAGPSGRAIGHLVFLGQTRLRLVILAQWLAVYHSILIGILVWIIIMLTEVCLWIQQRLSLNNTIQTLFWSLVLRDTKNTIKMFEHTYLISTLTSRRKPKLKSLQKCFCLKQQHHTTTIFMFTKESQRHGSQTFYSKMSKETRDSQRPLQSSDSEHQHCF